jgi:hypothetical protein
MWIPLHLANILIAGNNLSLEKPMKRLLVVAAGTVALMSGAAYAGGEGGCNYGKHLASETAKTPVMAAVDAAEAERLAKLKAIEEQASLDASFVAPVIHN